MTKAQSAFFLFVLFLPTIRNYRSLYDNGYLSLWILIPLFLFTTIAVWKLINVLIYNNDQAQKAKRILDSMVKKLSLEHGNENENRD